jgi:hypothetical protein
MKQSVRRGIVGLSLIAALGGGAWGAQTLLAQSAPNGGRQNQNRKERHPILQNSIRQIEGVRDHLQQAPWDFAGHKVAAISALNLALNELHQAEKADQK